MVEIPKLLNKITRYCKKLNCASDIKNFPGKVHLCGNSKTMMQTY